MMKRARIAVLSLLAAALAACHDDPDVITVVITPTASGFAVTTCGGDGASSGAGIGDGGFGGIIDLLAVDSIDVGGNTTVPGLPSIPTIPTTGNLVDTVELATQPGAYSDPGTLIISGDVTVDPGAGTIQTIQSDNGDIIVSGTLRSADIAGPEDQADISLLAPNGTVYITGTVFAGSSDVSFNGDASGDLTILAAHVVITGTIDATGEDNTGLDGGTGGAVDIDSTVGDVLLVNGEILTSGGDSDVTGGAGAMVDVTAATGAILFGTITTDGGTVAAGVAAALGGAAGDVSVTGGGAIDVRSTVSQRGGASTTTAADSVGGMGGSFTADGAVPCRLYSSIDASGGAAVGTGAPVTGGDGGSVVVGGVTRPLSLEMGGGPFMSCGGGGEALSRIGAAISIDSDSGPISLGGDLDTRGGSGIGTGSPNGADGGNVTIATNGGALNPASVFFFATASIDTSGGIGIGAGAGGTAGSVAVTGGLDVTVDGRISALGGASGTAAGGAGNTVMITCDNVGDIVLNGTVETDGAAGDSGGLGGAVTVSNTGATGGIVSTAGISTSGAAGTGAGIGGDAGAIGFDTVNGDITLSSFWTSNGGDSSVNPGGAGAHTVMCGGGGGSITSSVAITSNGGSSTAADTVSVSGDAGGSLTFDVGNNASSVTLLNGTNFTLNGGSGTGNLVGDTGGAGGMLTITTTDGPVLIRAGITARGGQADGVGGTGGQGGQVIVNSDNGGTTKGGDITLLAGSTINVSGGSGTNGGSARSGGPGDAVTFDADAANNLPAANHGIVLNSGSIVAQGDSTNGNGGNVFFDGQDGAVVPAIPAQGSVNVSGSGAGGAGAFLSQ